MKDLEAEQFAETPVIPLFTIFRHYRGAEWVKVDGNEIVTNRGWSYGFTNEAEQAFATIRAQYGLPTDLPAGTQVDLIENKIRVIGPCGTVAQFTIDDDKFTVQLAYERWAKTENREHRNKA